jgi:SAM-dependent methyltransferase
MQLAFAYFLLGILIFLSIFMILVLIYWIHQFRYSFSKDKIVFLPSNNKVVASVLDDLLTKYKVNFEQMYLIEPGCGIANISRYLSKYRWKQIWCIEYDKMTLIMAKIWNWYFKKDIKFLQGNIFELDLPTPSVIYCYLGQEIVTKMYETGKFQNSLVFSLSFSIKNGPIPTEIVKIKGFHKDLFIYDLRYL